MSLGRVQKVKRIGISHNLSNSVKVANQNTFEFLVSIFKAPSYAFKVAPFVV